MDRPRQELGLHEEFILRARRATDGQLALAAAVGLVGALGVTWWRPAAWPPLLALACASLAFGLWGIADRELVEHRRARGMLPRILRLLRALSAVAGLLSALVLLLSIAALGAGTWSH